MIKSAADRGRVARTAFLVVAAAQCFMLFGMALIGLLTNLGTVPSDPGPAGSPQGSSCAADSINSVILGLVGAPVALGLFAVLTTTLPGRRAWIVLATVWMAVLAAFASYSVAVGWVLPSWCDG